MRIKGIISLLFILQLATAIGQEQSLDISFILFDTETGKPIEDAFIFYEGTSIGTTSDVKGGATLPKSKIAQSYVVITHINYDNYNIEPDKLLQINRIGLNGRVLTLDMVTVKSKKLSKRKRKKWMKRFEKAFLGENISKKKIKIVNPEVLWFEEKDDVLFAYAADNIKIINQETAYEMQVALDHFSLTKDNDIKYLGRVFFKDIIQEFEDVKDLEKNRNDIFLSSHQLFYKSLSTQHPVLNQQFDFGITKNSKKGKLNYEERSRAQLNWQNEDSNTILYLDSSEYLTVMKKDILTQTRNRTWINAKSYQLHFATSFLNSRTGKFIFNEKGELLNKKDIEESGYWTNHRMAKELPLDYNGNISFEKHQHKIVKQLVDYETKRPAEKVYVQTDKSIYFPYETLWFKAYVLNAVDHKPSELSDVVYLELLNPDSDIIQSWMIHANTGFSGDYTWKPNAESGKYLLRAYTNYMRNEDANYFFEKTLELRNPVNNKGEQDVIIPDSILIEFYPEGGDLIVGISSNVAVKVTTKDGLPVDIKAQLINSVGTTITEFESMHKGLGILSFTPEKNETYSLIANYNNREFLFDLPDSKQLGISLEINPSQKDYVFVNTKVIKQDDLSGAYLVGHVRGSVFAYLTDLEKQEFKLSKSSIPTGVVHFTVFDKDNRPQAERLIFNEYGYDSQTISHTGLKKIESKEHIILNIDSLSRIDGLDLSASVVSVSNGFVNTNEDMKNYLLLQSDLEKTIPNVNQYLKENSASNLFFLDLYMRSMYWRRFNWKDLSNDKFQETDFHAEKNFSIQGYTSKADKEEGIESDITMNTLDTNIIYNQLRTDPDGSFSFRDIPLADSTEIFLQARLNNRKRDADSEDVQLKGNRLVDIHIESFNTSDLQQKDSFFEYETVQVESDEKDINHIDNTEEVQKYFLAQQKQDTGIWKIDIETIEISKRRNPISYAGPAQGFYAIDFDQANWIAPETQGIQIINKVAPRMNVYKGAEGKLVQITTNFRGQIIHIPMQVIIDGVGYNPEGSNVNRFYALPADHIKTMAVANGAIIVTTRNIPRSTEKYLKSGILTINHPGYSRAREFSNVDKANYPILSTSYWTPNVKLTKNGNIELPLNPNDLSTNHLVTIEGVSNTGKIISFIKLISSKEKIH